MPTVDKKGALLRGFFLTFSVFFFFFFSFFVFLVFLLLGTAENTISCWCFFTLSFFWGGGEWL